MKLLLFLLVTIVGYGQVKQKPTKPKPQSTSVQQPQIVALQPQIAASDYPSFTNKDLIIGEQKKFFFWRNDTMRVINVHMYEQNVIENSLWEYQNMEQDYERATLKNEQELQREKKNLARKKMEYQQLLDLKFAKPKKQ